MTMGPRNLSGGPGTCSADLTPAQVTEGGEVLLVGEASARVVVRRVP